MTTIGKPLFLSVNKLSEDQKMSLPALYYIAWRKHGLCKSEKEAEKVLDFAPCYSFALMDKSTEKVHGLLNTLPLAIDPKKIAKGFPTYDLVEEAAKQKKSIKKIKTILCFSIVAAPNTKVRSADQNISCSRYMISALKKKFPGKAIAVYTRLSGMPKGMTAGEYYEENKDDLTKLGSVGMHAHLGASLPPVAIIENARPEDITGGRANVVMVYENLI